MRFWKTIIGTGLITLAIWTLFAWPLPIHVTTTIPAAAHRAAVDFQPMIPGDHLQFMYYCWLAGDWLTKHTPLFYNLYEFNTGDLRTCFHPDTYYIPFSLIFNAGAALGGRAFGWNLTGFISLWLTYLSTLLLTRRYSTSEWIAWLTALLGILVPYRWVNLFGGSPAGFAMMWIPVVLLGIDLAVREGRIAGGLIAGLGIIGAAWGDMHVFFFSGLAAVGWCFIAFSVRDTRPWLSWRYVGRCTLALLPFLVCLAFALKFPKLMKLLTEHVTGQAAINFSVGPRPLREVALFSPKLPGYWSRSSHDVSEQIYLGYTLFLLLTMGWLALLIRAWRAPHTEGRRWLTSILLGVGMVGVMYLALGYFAPFHARGFTFARKLLTPYALIRNPAKILCVMPTLLAASAALGLSALTLILRDWRWRMGLPLAALALVTWEYAGWIHPTLTQLDTTQAAYAAVAADARQLGKPPHAVVIVLWPGDSHYASLYQHYASLYRIRMVNGYNPFIQKGYFEDVFRRFESINQGVLSDEQIARLNDMGVHWVLFHENLFPEKVSPFPAAATLRNLLNHPRLKLLKQDGPVWAFRILAAPVFQGLENQPAEFSKAWKIFFPARQWEMERCPHSAACAVQADNDASAHTYALLAYTNAMVQIPPERFAFRPALRWLLRARGQGVLQCIQMVNHQPMTTNNLTFATTNWTWYPVPVTAFPDFSQVGFELRYIAGAVDLDYALLEDGDWPALAQGQTLELPGAIFFHSGMTDLTNSAAVFRVGHDSAGVSFYGPKLPLEAGDYQIEIKIASSAATGTALGDCNFDQNGATLASAPILAGQPARMSVHIANNWPVNFVFVYSGQGDMALQRLLFTRKN